MRMNRKDIPDFVTEYAKDFCDTVTDLVFPRRCPVCDEPVTFGREDIVLLPDRGRMRRSVRKICKECRPKLTYVGSVFCMKCGKTLKDEADVFCYDCRKREHCFEENRSLYEYGSVRKSIALLKHGRAEYADFFGEDMALHMKDKIHEWGAVHVIPVPLHTLRVKDRGFNQSELIARSLCRANDLCLHTDIVERIVNTRPQKELSCRERQKNLKKAFHIRQNDVKLDKVILIDDIYTTGSTFDEIARTLKEAGVGRVYGLTLAIGTGL